MTRFRRSASIWSWSIRYDMNLPWTYYLFTLLVSLSGHTGFCQEPITIGQKHPIHSAVLNETRSCWIYLPPDYTNTSYAPARFPVIYLLDGDTNFHSATAIQEFLAKGPYASIPQMIVVGIPNTDRTRDLTPTHTDLRELNGQKAFFPSSGGGETFVRFFKEELIPHIDSTYRTNGYRTLIGHSFGGLTALNILLNHTELFNAYVAIDPSLWWDNENLLKQSRKRLAEKNFNGRSLYLAMANKAVTTTDTSTDHARAIRAFTQTILPSHPQNGLRWQWQYYENNDHGNIPLPATYDGLRAIFKGFQLPVKEVALEPSLLAKTYQNVSAQLGYPFMPAESLVDWLGNYCLQQEKVDNAVRLFRMNAENYPKSAHACQRLSKALEQQGDKQAAQEWANKAQKLN